MPATRAPARSGGRSDESPLGGLGRLLRTDRWLLLALVVGTAVLLGPSTPVPAVRSPEARVALETARFLVTTATAGLLTTFGGGIGGPLRRGFIAALVVLGVTDLWFGVIPNVLDPAGAAAGETLLPWIAARYIAGVLLVIAGLEWPRWSDRALLGMALGVYVVVEAVVVLGGSRRTALAVADALSGPTPALVALELGPMVLFAVGALLASRLHERDQQPLERWLAAALLVGVFTQLHTAALPTGLGPVITSADLLRALSTGLLLVGAVQQVVQLRRDRTRALELSQADVRELREVSDRLQEYVDAEASFRSVVTHELSTPVATISACAHLLAAAPLDADTRRAAQAIDAEARRLRSLIARMDDHALQEADALAVEPRPVLVAPLLAEAAAFGRAVAGAHPVSVHAEDAVVTADPTRVSQILRNLVGNAARYSPSGTAIDIAGHRDGGAYEIVVADEGPGFGVDDAEPLFDKYRRGASAGQVEGTGLGLWIAREVATAHGGAVDVLEPSRPGGRVRLRLPLTPQAAGTRDQGEQPAASQGERP